MTASLSRRQNVWAAILKSAEEVIQPTSLSETLDAIVKQALTAIPELDCVTLWYRHPDTGKVVAGPSLGVKNPEYGEGDTNKSSLVGNPYAVNRTSVGTECDAIPPFRS